MKYTKNTIIHACFNIRIPGIIVICRRVLWCYLEMDYAGAKNLNFKGKILKEVVEVDRVN